MKEEMPLFFFHGVEFLASSEYLFDVDGPVSESGGVPLLIDRSPMEKLADWRKEGLIIFAFGVVYDSGGGPGLLREF